MAGIALLVAGNLVLARTDGVAWMVVGVFLWGGHMALTQGLFARLVADCAPEQLRATTFGLFHFATGIATLLASVAAGLLWERQGPEAAFTASAVVAALAGMLVMSLPPSGRAAR